MKPNTIEYAIKHVSCLNAYVKIFAFWIFLITAGVAYLIASEIYG